MLSTKVVQPFNPSWATVVFTDASRLNGIGFALVQYDPRRTDGKRQFALVQCGSSSLTSAQGNYATIELECLAIQYALSKSEFYLRGLPTFTVWTDHRPLVGIFNKALHTLNNQRLIRIREKLLDFSFTVTWVPGKTHYIADALSRYPVFGPHEMELPIDDIATCFRVNGFMSLEHIFSTVDKVYTCLLYTSPSPRDQRGSRMPSSA